MKYREFVAGTAFLMVLATACALVFWFVIHSKEVDHIARDVAFKSMKGNQAPAFSVRTIDGRQVSLAGRAKPMLVEVFATWCEICTSEIPTLNRLAREHHDIDVVAITGDSKGANLEPESINDLRAYRTRKNVHYELALDLSLQVARDYKVVGFPSIYVLNRRSEVTFNDAGAVSFSDLQKAIAVASR